MKPGRPWRYSGGRWLAVLRYRTDERGLLAITAGYEPRPGRVLYWVRNWVTRSYSEGSTLTEEEAKAVCEGYALAYDSCGA